MSASDCLRLCRFNHTAMRAEWNFLLATDDPDEAEAAAHAAFREIDELEAELSRFRPDSDLCRIARLQPGEEISVGLAAWDCLTLAQEVAQATGGAFDCAIGPLYELWHGRPAADPPREEEIAAARARSGSHLFELHEEGRRVRALTAGLKLDLGALGKGYALDLCADLLREHWGMENALLITGGGSTILATGKAPNGGPWFVNAGPEGTPATPLENRAVSASGFIYQGAHIIDPRTGYPVSTEKIRAWAFAQSAALSDALSTAFLVMTGEEIEAFIRDYPDVEARR